MIDVHRLKRLLTRLIDIYSPSGKEEEILSYLKGFLKRQGLSPTIQAVDENRYNIVMAPLSSEIRMAFVGHLDTVTAYDLDNYSAVEKDGEIIGLGAADMKGGCAAMIESYLTLYKTHGPDIPFALCLVVGEEETGDGAAQLMKEYRFPWALIGEPTNLKPCFRSYGYIESQIKTAGKRQHASMAGRKENAVEALLEGLLRFTNHMEAKKPDIIYNIRDLYTPKAGFAVPEYSEAWIDIHVPPDISIGEIITEIEDIVTTRGNEATSITLEYITETIDSGYEIPLKGHRLELVKSVFSENGLPWSTDSFRSHSDANQIFSAGARPVILGPGHLEKAHAQDESVSFYQVTKAAEVYLSLMKKIMDQ